MCRSRFFAGWPSYHLFMVRKAEDQAHRRSNRCASAPNKAMPERSRAWVWRTSWARERSSAMTPKHFAGSEKPPIKVMLLGNLGLPLCMRAAEPCLRIQPRRRDGTVKLPIKGRLSRNVRSDSCMGTELVWPETRSEEH